MVTWNPQSKSSAPSWGGQSKSANPSWATQSRGTGGATLATAGQYRGFGAFNYAGGEILVPGTLPAWTTQSKS